MPSLESSLTAWRQQMQTAGIESSRMLDELENHLREEIQRQTAAGADEATALAAAVALMGPPGSLGDEFKKIAPRHWNRPLAWAAWSVFAISFLLPVMPEFRGWQCACISATAITWQEFRQVDWQTIHLILLTPANLLMLASPVLLVKFSGSRRGLRWLRWSSWTAMVLVWSYILMGIYQGGGQGLEIGCYLWVISFLLLALATVPFQRSNAQTVVS